MVALKKILLLMLVICTLGYGSAWAYDGHAVDFNSDEFVVVEATAAHVNAPVSAAQDSEQSPEQSPAVNADCDHCCHISAHMMAIFMRSGYLCSNNQSSERLELFETFVSVIVSPDFRPPRV